MDNSPGPIPRKSGVRKSRSIHTTTLSSSVTQAQASAAPGNISTPTKQAVSKMPAVSPAHSLPENISFTAEDEAVLDQEYPDIEKLDEAHLVDAWNKFAAHVSVFVLHQCF